MNYLFAYALLITVYTCAVCVMCIMLGCLKEWLKPCKKKQREQTQSVASGLPLGQSVPQTQITSNTSRVKCKNPPRHQQGVLSPHIRSCLSYHFVTRTYHTDSSFLEITFI